MFLGQYHHNLDDKGRLTIPARFRDPLTEGVYITQGFESNLLAFTAASFERIAQRINQMSLTDPAVRQLRRLLFSAATLTEVDRSGRILLPPFLREVAGIQTEALLIGAGDYFEIWSPANWQPQAETLRDTQANQQRFAAFNLFSGEL